MDHRPGCDCQHCPEYITFETFGASIDWIAVGCIDEEREDAEVYDKVKAAYNGDRVKAAILKAASNGSNRLLDLVRSVVRSTRSDADVVTAKIWELVDDGQLAYGPDAKPKIVREGE
jgi:hypothetical protein